MANVTLCAKGSSVSSGTATAGLVSECEHEWVCRYHYDMEAESNVCYVRQKDML